MKYNLRLLTPARIKTSAAWITSCSTIPLLITRRNLSELPSGAMAALLSPLCSRRLISSGLKASARKEENESEQLSRIRYSAICFRPPGRAISMPSKPILFMPAGLLPSAFTIASADHKRGGRYTKPAAQKRHPRLQSHLPCCYSGG